MPRNIMRAGLFCDIVILRKSKLTYEKSPESYVDKIASIIVRTIDPEQVILFGSAARGSAGPNSDLDILVVDSRPFNRKRTRMSVYVRLLNAVFSFPVPIDILVFSRDKVLEWQDSRNHVIGRALREGRVLYEKTR